MIAAASGAVGATLWWRRSRPDLVAAVVIVAYVVTFTPVALAVAMYTIGTVRQRPGILAAYAAAGFAAGIAGLRGGLPDAGVREAAYSLALILGPLAVGYVVAVRRDLTAATQARVADLEREQLVLDERARAEERGAIAREMHDVVGHRVSNMVLAAGALQVGPAAGHPDVVRTAELIRSDGRQALEELREILGVLSVGHPVHWAPTAPQPDVDQVPGIVAHATERGQSVQLQINGHPETLSPPVQRAVHRIVQESLTNAAKHAPGARVRVDVDCRSDGVHVGVGNGAPTGRPSADLPSGGHGLVGLTERVELLGGALTAGPHGDGFLVSVFIPHRRGVS
ncbi:histidine kinase [Streptomyces sp900116325]|uniref:sensor histidine kinase n=1 Tax=Streptomyces sp. 900116325 TaxID=3154295 RepID=UPI0033A1F2CE